MDIENFFQNMDASVAGEAGGKKIGRIWADFMRQLASNPALWLETVREGQEKQLKIISQQEQVIEPKKSDRRFKSEQWTTNPMFSMLMQSYLLNSDILRALADKVDMPDKDKELLHFAINQYIDAMSPTNFPATNPEVIEEAVKTGGESITKGMQNLMQDMQNRTMVQNTDRTAFTIGDNIATTPGSVVMQTPLMQLIEYAPKTDKVHARPLLIVPPCINKYYILDLTAEKSMVAHLVDAGHRVFLVSWVNAGDDVQHTTWDDYLREGVMAAIEATQSITKQPKINTMGFCIGGTLLVSALAAMAAGGEQPAQSITLMASMLDFSDTGEIGLFIDEETVAERERQFANGGLMDGSELARGFATMRPNDLIWPYVIGNYYQGKTPPAFDLLYWNADSTNLPGPMFAEYLRITYHENQISNGTAKMCGTAIEPSRIDADIYSVACEKDHIVPWKTAYTSIKLFTGKKPRFVLAASGHIAGIINPPATKKGWHLTGDTTAADADTWRETTTQHEGSWWSDWFAFLSERGGGKVPAPTRPGNTRHAPTQPAPGSYVSIPRPPINNPSPAPKTTAQTESPAPAPASKDSPQPTAATAATTAKKPAAAKKTKATKAAKPAKKPAKKPPRKTAK